MFHEVYVQAALATCERRDPKGLYRRAHAGEIPEFTGVSAPYEPPEAPELVIDTDAAGVDECVETLVAYAERAFKP
jgi:bifunctional enzyme CysN/CysC